MSENEASEAAKQARRAYWKEYRRKNPDKVREYQQRYYEKHREKMNEYQRSWRKKNPDRYRETQARYWAKRAAAAAEQAAEPVSDPENE